MRGPSIWQPNKDINNQPISFIFNNNLFMSAYDPNSYSKKMEIEFLNKFMKENSIEGQGVWLVRESISYYDKCCVTLVKMFAKNISASDQPPDEIYLSDSKYKLAKEVIADNDKKCFYLSYDLFFIGNDGKLEWKKADNMSLLDNAKALDKKIINEENVINSLYEVISQCIPNSFKAEPCQPKFRPDASNQHERYLSGAYTTYTSLRASSEYNSMQKKSKQESIKSTEDSPEKNIPEANGF